MKLWQRFAINCMGVSSTIRKFCFHFQFLFVSHFLSHSKLLCSCLSLELSSNLPQLIHIQHPNFLQFDILCITLGMWIWVFVVDWHIFLERVSKYTLGCVQFHVCGWLEYLYRTIALVISVSVSLRDKRSRDVIFRKGPIQNVIKQFFESAIDFT